MDVPTASDRTVIILSVCLLGLIALLIFLYKKLNKENNSVYTIRNMVYKEGGLRDQVRGAAQAVGTRLGIQLWPRSDTDEYGEEIQDEEGQVEEGDSQGSHSEGGDHEEEEEEEEDVEQHGEGETDGDGDHTSDDTTSLESVEVGEQTRLTGQPEAKRKETEEKEAEEGNKGPGLLIDLKQFSGSAIWSGEEGGNRDVTAL
ncbi:retrotransposon-like protein 1 [Solea solea]|uniref:retrotransposon-like protein 1 n=1 Tax=Solea solea TaxID=90069 RepID=UPI0027296843|nr:retrotransposon-like protein 1 [Solea solea]